MAILVGIDGTGGDFTPGRARNKRYDEAFASSFVHRLCTPNSVDRQYFRGPVALGGGLAQAISDGADFIVGRRKAGVTAPILLTGYSRGAAGVVAMAAALKREKIKVHALLMFDCVDRHMFVDAETVPNNVEYVFHVVRNPDSRSRESFDNDGLRYRPPTNYGTAYSFMCTHGGMGGTPWVPAEGVDADELIDEGGVDGKTKITYAEDAKVSKYIWNFVQPFVQKHGFI